MNKVLEANSILVGRVATNRQIECAVEIANKLGLDCPDFSDFIATADFINNNLAEFNKISMEEGWYGNKEDY